MSDRPELSVVVLSYNNANYIVECLESITRQNVSSYEVIIVDDSSTDDSVMIIQNYISDKPQFTLIEKENSGGAISSQIGIAKAQGAFLAIVDSDDYVLDGAYGVLIERIKRDGSDFAIGTPVKMNESYLFNIPNYEASLFTMNRILETVDERSEVSQQGFYWNAVYKTDFIKKNSIQMPSDLIVADRIFLYKAMIRAKKISIEKNLTYCWRKKVNLKSKSITDRGSEFSLMVDRCDSFLAQMRLTMEEASQSACINRNMWGNTIERILLPLYSLCKNEADLDQIIKCLEHLRGVFLEFPMFFYRLTVDSNAPLKARYSIYLIMKKEFERLIDFLQEKEDYFAYPAGELSVGMYNAILRENKTLFPRDIVFKDSKPVLLVGIRSELEKSNALKINSIYAVTRFFEFKRIDLKYNNGEIDLSELPPTEYSIRVEYTLFGKHYSESLSSPRNFARIIEDESSDMIVRYRTRLGLLEICKRNKFTLMKMGKDCYLRVNDKTVKRLFYYNIPHNSRSNLTMVENGTVRINGSHLPEGKNVLVYQDQNGLFNRVKSAECSNNKMQFMCFEEVFQGGQIEITI